MAECQEYLEEHRHQSVIQGHHIQKDIWSPYTTECLTLQREGSNTHDIHTVCLILSLIHCRCTFIMTISSYTPRKFVYYAPGNICGSEGLMPP